MNLDVPALCRRDAKFDLALRAVTLASMLRNDGVAHVQSDANGIVRDRAEADFGAIPKEDRYAVALVSDLIDETDHERGEVLWDSAAYSPCALWVP